VHAHGGHVLIYRDLARYLGPDQPVYGLQAAGPENLGSRPATAEQMALRYLEEIRSLQLEGPYHLCGYCSGGLMAYEMARQLVQAGQPVGLVALFDTTRPGYSFYPPGMSPWRRKFYNWAHYAQLHWYDLRMLQGHERLDYFTRRAGNAAKALAGTLTGRLQRATGSIRQDAMPALPNELELTRQLIRQAIREYVPPAYPGRIVLFRANRLPLGVCVDPGLGWSTAAVGELAIKELPGFHGASVLEPGVRVLAKLLTTCLDEDCSSASIRS
jgi:aspartate racemase